MGFDFDLRELNPKEGDLILLVNREFRQVPNLLAIFDKFLDDPKEAGFNIIRLSRVAQICDFKAKKVAYLKPSREFGSMFLPDLQDISSRSVSTAYSPEAGYVGVENVIKALREEEEYKIYADIIENQLLKLPQEIRVF